MGNNTYQNVKEGSGEEVEYEEVQEEKVHLAGELQLFHLNSLLS